MWPHRIVISSLRGIPAFYTVFDNLIKSIVWLYAEEWKAKTKKNLLDSYSDTIYYVIVEDIYQS